MRCLSCCIMGNKLCAAWKRGYRDEAHPWAPKKDSHLLRLWAEIFEVQEEEREICWARVSDDVVPVNITCIQDTPETVFQITAYNRHVEKIFDVRLIQPGTRITQASECFVHWKDSKLEHEWGLNFTTPVDARRFRDCCMAPAVQGQARKASSSASLRLSPPKRVKGRKTASNPTSPLGQPRRAISTPEELALQDQEAVEAGFSPRSHREFVVDTHDGHVTTVEAIATAPRGGNPRIIPHAQSVFDNNQSGIYDNIEGVRRSQRYENPYQKLPVHANAHKPIGEREIPYGQYCSNHRSSQREYSSSSYNPRHRHTIAEDTLSSVIYDECRGRSLDHSEPTPDQLPHAIYQDPADTEIRQFSREPTCIELSDRHITESHYDNVAQLRHQQRRAQQDNPELIRLQDPPLDARQRRKRLQNTLKLPGQSQSVESGEWPPPPPAAGGGTDHQLQQGPPKSPDTPGAAGFDSSTLKKMLRNLPRSASPRYDNEEEFEFDEECAGYQPPYSTSSSPTKSTCQHDVTMTSFPTTETLGPRPQSRPIDLSHHVAPPHGKPPIGPVKPQRIPLDGPDSDTSARHSRIRDSYPDSGISGMTNETSGSVKSDESDRSKRSRKARTLPPGLGLSSLASRRSNRSSGCSSGGSSSGQQSDLIQQSVGDTDSHARHVTSDLSESETESSCSEHGTSDSSSINTMPTESQASYASKSAAIRKAGWLTVKNWLVHKKRKVELAPKRTWKRYWVCLKGTMLLFYFCEENETVDEGSVPRHVLMIEGGIAQAVPEHPKRENIFALSTAFGDAYLFQATSQIELENWINGIHSACASSFARQHGKENTLKLLRSEIQRLENSIDLDIKMKKMAGLQLTVITDARSKQAIDKQIAQWDENLEKLYIEQYRLRCYMASLQGSELPNPKNLLSYVAKTSKAILSRVGVFTVTSFHALVCARAPLTAASLYSRKQKRGILSTFKADSVTKIRPRSPKPFSPQHGQDVPVDLSTTNDEMGNEMQQANMEAIQCGDSIIRINLPGGNQSVVVGINEKMSVQEVLESACNKRQLNPTDHFMRLKLNGLDNFKFPEKTSLLQSEEYESVEICPKILFQIELSKGDRDREFGFAIEAELAEDTEQEDELCIFISEVIKGGLAQRKGLVVGDEILVINGRVVADLDMVYVENLLSDLDAVCLTIRSCRVERPVNTTALMEHADLYIDSMMCPPPPSQSRISDKVIGDLIIPAPNWVPSAEHGDQDNVGGGAPGEHSPRHGGREVSNMSHEQIDHLLQGAEQVTHFCRLLHEPAQESARNNGETQPMSKPLTDSQRIRKVIVELIETERAYVKDLNCLIERYLDPLKEETFLSGEDTEQIFGNIQEIVQFQKQFLRSLEEAVELEPNFSILSEPSKFRDEDLRRILFSLGGSFMYYANHFKLYSSFCASHSKAQRVLNPESNARLQEFLRARNPKQQHSATLESYLIKPIQRILKYPLLLRQLKDLTDLHTDEHHHLMEALRGMEAVAEHINEMQKIYEEYGTVFEDLIEQYKEAHPHTRALELNVGELQMYGSVNWLNALDELGKMKKGTELITLLFIFKSGVVLLSQERIRGKKNKPKASPQSKQSQPPDPSEVTNRFQAGVPVDQLQVRTAVGDEQERHGIWELAHCRSEQEGRPEKVYQFASSHAARRDFIRTINNTIRESVRRMSLPQAKGNGTIANNKGKPSNIHHHHHHHHPSQQQQQQQHRHHQHTPLEQTMSEQEYDYPDQLLLQDSNSSINNKHIPSSTGNRRPDTLVASSNTIHGTHDRVPRPQLQVRHSMDIDDRVGGRVEQQKNLSDFRTRSQTLSDLNNAGSMDEGNYQAGSQSTLASDRGSNAAKLLHSSHDPLDFNAGQPEPIENEGPGSPIWKPRNATIPPKKHVTLRGTLSDDRPSLESAVFSGSAYGDYSNVYQDTRKKQVLIIPPNSYVETEDTEC